MTRDQFLVLTDGRVVSLPNYISENRVHINTFQYYGGVSFSDWYAESVPGLTDLCTTFSSTRNAFHHTDYVIPYDKIAYASFPTGAPCPTSL